MTGLVENARLSSCFEYFRSCSYLCLVFQVRFSVFLRFSRSLCVFLVFVVFLSLLQGFFLLPSLYYLFFVASSCFLLFLQVVFLLFA